MSRIIILFVAIVSISALASSARAQCRTTDKSVQKPLAVSHGTATIRDTIRLCTSHVYHLKANKGQRMIIKLTTGKKTSMTVLPPSGDALIDGQLNWSGQLTETGEYEIQIGTDATAKYTLEISIK